MINKDFVSFDACAWPTIHPCASPRSPPQPAIRSSGLADDEPLVPPAPQAALRTPPPRWRAGRPTPERGVPPPRSLPPRPPQARTARPVRRGRHRRRPAGESGRILKVSWQPFRPCGACTAPSVETGCSLRPKCRSTVPIATCSIERPDSRGGHVKGRRLRVGWHAFPTAANG